MILPHQQRVLDEKKELDEKRVKLFHFFQTKAFTDLDLGEQDRLRAQYGAMTLYADILNMRISAWA